MKRTKRGQSIQNRIFWPIMMVVFVQMVVLLFAFLFGGLMTTITNQSETNLIEKNNNQTNGIKNKMIKEWSLIDSFNKSIADVIDNMLTGNGEQLTAQDMLDSTEFSEQAIVASSFYVVNMIRATGATGAYMILDTSYGGPGGKENVHPGIYVRDLQPDNDAADNSDLMMQVGSSQVSQMLQMPLTSYWTARFDFDNGDYSDVSFYYNPLLQAKRIPGKKAKDYAYWSDVYTFDNAGEPIISYSQPIILADGSVVGVIGVDISQTEIASVIQSDSSKRDTTSCCVLTKVYDKDPNSLMVMGQYGNLFVYNFGDDKRIRLLGSKGNFYEVENRVNDKTTVYMQEIPLYNTGSPFKSQKWMVLTCKNNKEMYSVVNVCRRYVVIITALTFLCMVIAVRLASKSISLPITSLSDMIHMMDASQELKVKRTGIVEVDELMLAFRDLRGMTMEHLSKLSEIISITSLPVGIFEYDREGKVFFCSSSFYEILNLKEGQSAGMVMSYEDYQQMWTSLNQYLYDDERMIYELQGENGLLRWVQLHIRKNDQKDIGAVVDVTSEILEQKKIAYERDFDLLTGLWNRRAFMRRVDEVMLSKDKVGVSAMLMVDTDNLKYVNDTYGHETGDNYLRLIANELSGFSSYGGIVGRRSGDEFTVFLYNFKEQQEIRDVVNQVWRELNRSTLPLPDASNIGLRCSAGLAWFGTDSDNMNQLIRYADFAMYEVKHSQKGSWCEFNAEHFQNESLLLYGHKSFDMLLSDRMLDFAMQPIYYVKERRVYGYEMLMRSQLPEFRSPYDILRMAHSQSKMYQLEYTCWYRALETFALKIQQGELDSNCHAFVNSIGSVYLSERDEQCLVNLFQPYMSRIVVELTEEEESTEEAISRKVEAIKRLKGLVAIDDYGSGYNNVSSVLDINPDIIKVDLKIVRNIDKDTERQLLFRQAVSIARAKGALVVAEGVETKSELEWVLRLGADLIQGYYLAVPAFAPDCISEEALAVMDTFLKVNESNHWI